MSKLALQEVAIDLLRQTGRAPSPNGSPKERRIYIAFSDRIKCDTKYRRRARRFGWVPRAERNSTTEDAIIAFIIEHKRLPKRTVLDFEERRLSQGCSSRLCKSNTLYDLAFVRRVNSALRDVGAVE